MAISFGTSMKGISYEPPHGSLRGNRIRAGGDDVMNLLRGSEGKAVVGQLPKSLRMANNSHTLSDLAPVVSIKAIPTADAEFSATVVLIVPQPVGAGHEQNYPRR